ncbi:SHOCT domain-containing protein [Corallococcus sp. RDP092CA]|uniref:SHOCT domain-containing protein n=1 Tax=Corallococcus sp. RDP092CA TaxID=3109369 RepID=UPI0035B09A68
MFDAITSDPALLVLLIVVAGGMGLAFGPKAGVLGLLGAGPERAVLEHGEPGEATVLEVRDSALRINRRSILQLLLEVRIPGRAPYQARVSKKLPAHSSTATWGPGLRVQVKADPKQPQHVVITGFVMTAPASPPAPPADPVRAMEDLKRMAERGLITEREYEEKKAEILGRL